MSEALFEEVFYRTISPLHIGRGVDVGVVDLPVIREGITGYPYLPASGIRGSVRDRLEQWDRMRDRLEQRDRAMAIRLFGSEPLAKNLSMGCVRFLDARILLFPVRSAPGIFHWITSPLVLSRFQRDRAALLSAGKGNEVPLPHGSPDQTHCWGKGTGNRLFLEEYPFTPETSPWKWNLPIDGVEAERVVLVHDDVFRFFVQDATMILQRNRLTSVKTVAQRALFSLEAIPPETIFYGFLGISDEISDENTSREHRSDENTSREHRSDDDTPPLSKEEIAQTLRQGLHETEGGRPRASAGEEEKAEEEIPSIFHLQLGGDTSIGMGMTRMEWTSP